LRCRLQKNQTIQEKFNNLFRGYSWSVFAAVTIPEEKETVGQGKIKNKEECFAMLEEMETVKQGMEVIE
jgi:hypothetical protein